MSLLQKSRTVLYNQLEETVSGLCLLRLPEVMLSRGPALLEEDKHLEKQIDLPKELAVVNDIVDCGVTFIQDFNE